MLLKAVFLLVGTTIGAGIFALPYSFLVSGPVISVLGLLFLTLITTSLNLFYAQIILKTKGDHQLAGYASIWLGPRAKKIALVAIILSCYGALFAYVVLGGDFLALIFSHQPTFYHSLLFFLAGSIIIFKGLKTISWIEEYLTFFLILLALLIPLVGIKYTQLVNLTIPATDKFAFYGPVLFSLAGLAVIPEAEEILRKKHSLLKKAIILGAVLPAIIYLVFALGILSISGAATTADALSGLIAWSPGLVKVGAVVGVLATFTSFISLTNVIKEVFYRDLGIDRKRAISLALLPLAPAVFLAPIWFLTIVSWSGSITVGLAGIIICSIAIKAVAHRPWQKITLAMIIFVLALGMLAAIV